MQRPVQPFGQGKLRRALAVGSLCLTLLGCSLESAEPSIWRLGPESVEQLQKDHPDPKAAQAELLQALESLYGTATAPRWPLGDPDLAGQHVLREASATYRSECAHCHGMEGYGNGPSSQFVAPKPWNFSFGVFPKSAQYGSDASPEALAQLLEKGIPSSAMPNFARLGKARLRAVAGHVLLLSQRSQLERSLAKVLVQEGSGSLTPERTRACFEEWERKTNAQPDTER